MNCSAECQECDYALGNTTVDAAQSHADTMQHTVFVLLLVPKTLIPQAASD